MFKLIPSILSLLIIATVASATFIEDSCKSTLYPNDCTELFASRAADIGDDPQKLVKIALTENLAKTQDLKSSMSNMATQAGLKANEHAALKDCLDEIDDGEDQLKKSIEEINLIGSAVGQNFDFRLSNIKTWVSSVYTNFDSCGDEFDQPNIVGPTKDTIKPKLEKLQRATSNALALINRIPLKNQ